MKFGDMTFKQIAEICFKRSGVNIAAVFTAFKAFESVSIMVISCPLPLNISAKWPPISPIPAITIFIFSYDICTIRAI